jgi:hypothetical protein
MYHLTALWNCKLSSFHYVLSTLGRLYSLPYHWATVAHPSWGKFNQSFYCTLPRHPDSTVLANMSDLGYNPCKIFKSPIRQKIQWGSGQVTNADTEDMPGVSISICIVEGGPVPPKAWPTILLLYLIMKKLFNYAPWTLVRCPLWCTSWDKCGSSKVRKVHWVLILRLPKHLDPTILASMSDRDTTQVRSESPY